VRRGLAQYARFITELFAMKEPLKCRPIPTIRISVSRGSTTKSLACASGISNAGSTFAWSCSYYWSELPASLAKFELPKRQQRVQTLS
jgi:hypothetical protein